MSISQQKHVNYHRYSLELTWIVVSISNLQVVVNFLVHASVTGDIDQESVSYLVLLDQYYTAAHQFTI